MKKLEDVSVIGLMIINCPFVILALGPMPPYGAYLARLYPNMTEKFQSKSGQG